MLPLSKKALFLPEYILFNVEYKILLNLCDVPR